MEIRWRFHVPLSPTFHGRSQACSGVSKGTQICSQDLSATPKNLLIQSQTTPNHEMESNESQNEVLELKLRPNQSPGCSESNGNPPESPIPLIIPQNCEILKNKKSKNPESSTAMGGAL